MVTTLRRPLSGERRRFGACNGTASAKKAADGGTGGGGKRKEADSAGVWRVGGTDGTGAEVLPGDTCDHQGEALAPCISGAPGCAPGVKGVDAGRGVGA